MTGDRKVHTYLTSLQLLATGLCKYTHTWPYLPPEIKGLKVQYVYYIVIAML